MAKKKFGKFLLFSAAVGAVAAGAYYYFQNKEKISNDDFDEDDDFDDFSEDLDSESAHTDPAERSYVSLDLNNENASSSGSEKTAENDFDTKEALNNLEKAAESAKAEVEEFFDEDEEDPYGEGKA